MLEWLAGLRDAQMGMLIGLVFVLGVMLVGAIKIVASQWGRVRQAEIQARQVEVEAALKQDMLNRGMSADDIERVLSAGQAKTSRPVPREQAPAREMAGCKR